jgi:hypothetical protein
LAKLETTSQSDAALITFRDPEEWGASRFIASMTCAGLLNASIVALIFCRLPASHSPTITSLFIRAMVYVAMTAAGGVAGMRFYWSRFSGRLASTLPASFPLFALVSALAWIWLPAAILLSPQDSPATPLIVSAGAAMLAMGLRKAVLVPITFDAGERELFADVLRSPSRSADGYIVSACIYLAFFAFAARQDLNASAPLAICAWLITWRLTFAPTEVPDNRKQMAGAVRRLAWTTPVAIFVTLFALLFGVEHRNRLTAGAGLNPSANDIASSEHRRKNSHDNSLGGSGYESIILWPVPEKRQIVAPVPPRFDLLPLGGKRPLIFPFTGSYWYFQPPNTGPGLRAHRAQDSPLRVSIQSTNAIPVTMEAHQKLGGSIRLVRCREIQVRIAYRDGDRGTLAVAMLLTDSALSGKPTQYLGQQPILSSAPDSSAPAEQVLSFEIPDHARIRKFDEIATVFLADPLHQLSAPKIAIEQFEIVPR